MEIDAKSQHNQDPASFPSAASHAFTPYALAFGEFAEPRTIPAQWDLSELMDPNDRLRNKGAQQPEESASRDHGER